MKHLLFLIAMGWLVNTQVYAAESTVQLAAIDHSRLSASAQCIRCHKRDQPDDNLHRRTQANCSTCHTTRQWTPTITEP